MSDRDEELSPAERTALKTQLDSLTADLPPEVLARLAAARISSQQRSWPYTWVQIGAHVPLSAWNRVAVSVLEPHWLLRAIPSGAIAILVIGLGIALSHIESPMDPLDAMMLDGTANATRSISAEQEIEFYESLDFVFWLNEAVGREG